MAIPDFCSPRDKKFNKLIDVWDKWSESKEVKKLLADPDSAF